MLQNQNGQTAEDFTNIGLIPLELSRKRNMITWTQKLRSSRKIARAKIFEKYMCINEFTYVIKKDDNTTVTDTTSILVDRNSSIVIY